MTSEGLEEMFEGDSADMCAGKLEGLACADPGVRIPIGVGGILKVLVFQSVHSRLKFECQIKRGTSGKDRFSVWER
jgi:hypothetical protein